MVDTRTSFIEHLLETLSLAACCETQDPPNPITRAALHQSVQDLIAELQALNGNANPARSNV
jgi:hypothetical protein